MVWCGVVGGRGSRKKAITVHMQHVTTASSPVISLHHGASNARDCLRLRADVPGKHKIEQVLGNIAKHVESIRRVQAVHQGAGTTSLGVAQLRRRLEVALDNPSNGQFAVPVGHVEESAALLLQRDIVDDERDLFPDFLLHWQHICEVHLARLHAP